MALGRSALLVLALVLATGLALNHWREPLGRWLVPEAPLTRQLLVAQRALARGELSRADGQGARELFQAALAVDPDNPSARQGLQDVRNAALALAQSAIDRGERQPALEALALAVALSAPAASVEPLRQRLQAIGQPADAAEQELISAQSWVSQGRLDEALVVFERVLQRQPNNAVALAGRREVLSAWLLQAGKQLDAGQLELAQVLVAQVQQRDPAHLELQAVKARLGALQAEQRQRRAEQVQRNRRAELASQAAPKPVTAHLPRVAPVVADKRQLPRLLNQAAEAIGAGQLLQPPDNNAWDALQAAQAVAPDDAAVNEALRRFEQAAKDCFERQALANHLSDAEQCLAARSRRESAQSLADARRRLALRWLALGNERLGQNEPELAGHALASARRLDDRAPGLRELERRLALVLEPDQRP